MLSPISPARTGPSASTGSEAITFMSGSGMAPGMTITGSSPGRQRSIFWASQRRAKNRLRSQGEAIARRCGSAQGFRCLRNDLEVVVRSGFERQRHVELRERRRAQRGLKFGSSGARSTDGALSAVFAPLTSVLEFAGSSTAGARSAGPAVLPAEAAPR